MARFDWAGDGTFDITDISDEALKAKFKTMSDDEKNEILEDLEDAEEDAEAKAKAVAMMTQLGKMVMKGIDLLA